MSQMNNDIDYGRYMDSGAQRLLDADVDPPSEDSDASGGPSRRKSGAKAPKSRGPKVRTLNRWTPEEHERLAYLVAKWGSEKNWAKVAEEMPGRTGKQCRERWLNHMKPGIIKGNWSFEEEFLLAQCHAVVGSHWSKMTKRLPGRTENSIKNFWNATLRSKAPHKRRGILWLYMQEQTCQDGENVDAFLVAVARLYESHELPAYWAQLMEAGRLTERTLRAVLRAEKEFLENPDCELHPLALPHPTHGLLGTSDTGAATAGPAAAEAPECDTVSYEAQPVPPEPSSTQPAAGGSAAPSMAAPASFKPASPLPAPGLTPRFPEAADAAVAHNSMALCPAALQASAAMAGLCLPPEVFAALSAHEVWSGLPSSAQARTGAFNAAPASMEPLMPAMGLAADLHASGADGAFGANTSSALPAGHDSIWTCLPSLRGLGNNTAYGAAAPSINTPHVAADPLKLLEPFGALHAHRSSSSNIQGRPSSALELQQPVPAAGRRQAAGADSQMGGQMSRDSCSMDQQLLPASASPTGEGAHDAHAFHQQRQQQAAARVSHTHLHGTSIRQQQYTHEVSARSGADSPPTGDAYHSYQEAAAAGYSAHTHHCWAAPEGYSSEASMHAAAAAGYGISWGSHYQQYHQQQQQGTDEGDRGNSPTESAAQSGQVYGGGAQAPAHGVDCSSAYQQQHYAAQQISHGYTHPSSAWHHESADQAHEGAAPEQEQQQAAGVNIADDDMGHGAAHQRPCSVASARLQPVGRLQRQPSSTSSPFAQHASAAWDMAGGGHTDPANDSAPYHPGSMGPPAAAPGQQQPCARQHLQLAGLPGNSAAAAAAAALFSPRSVDSPMPGALQQLLDSAAAQAGVRAQDICAWLAAANSGQGAAQDADRGPAQQQQQPQQKSWLASELEAMQQQQQPQADQARGLSQLGISAHDDSSHTNTSSMAVHDPSFACSILEALLGPRHSAQLGDVLMSPAGLSCTAALLQGPLPPTPAAASAAAAAALQAAMVVGLKRERSFPDAQEDADLLIEQPGIKLPRVF